jgi:hypothetical protein
METEEAVEIHGGLGVAGDGARHRDAAARGVVAGIAVGDHHAETVHRATLEHGDEDLGPSRRALGVGGAHEEARDGSQPEQGQGAGPS